MKGGERNDGNRNVCQIHIRTKDVKWELNVIIRRHVYTKEKQRGKASRAAYGKIQELHKEDRGDLGEGPARDLQGRGGGKGRGAGGRGGGGVLNWERIS